MKRPPPPPAEPEIRRLESLWAGTFGDAYLERNKTVNEQRGHFWKTFLREFPVKNILEVGCNAGMNMPWISEAIGEENVFGIDINAAALRLLRQRFPGINALYSQARQLPFRDAWFDLVFTAGVLIHQPENALHDVTSEVVRCSRRYILCMEYYAPQTTEVPYHGQSGALFKRDYGTLYAQWFPQLRLRKTGFLGKDQGWDDVTFWIFERENGNA